MKTKEILNIANGTELEKIMTNDEFDRMTALNLDSEQLLGSLKSYAKSSGQNEDEEYITIRAHLDYLKVMG